MDGAMDETLSKLKAVLQRDDLKIKASKYLRTSFTGPDGTERPLKVRNYQIQMILHLVAMYRFIVGDDTGLGKCRTKDSLLITDHGMLRLGSLAPNATKMTPDNFYPMSKPVKVWTGWKWAPIRRFYYNGSKPTKKIRTRRGYEVTGSWVHPLWKRGSQGEQFTELQNLSIGDHLCLVRDAELAFPNTEPVLPVPPDIYAPNAIRYTTPTVLTPELAGFLGYVTAEAWVNSDSAICLTQHRDLNPEVHDHMRELAAQLFGWVGKPDDITIPIQSVILRAYMEGLGIDKGLSATKTVPWPIFQGTRESVRQFLRCYIDSEGSVTGGTIEVSSASEQLLKDVQCLLLRFGVVCTRRPKRIKGRNHTYWRIAICGSDARTYAQHIGFVSARKNTVFMGMPPNANLDVVPHAQGEVEALRAAILSATARCGSNDSRKGSGLKQFGVSFEKTLNNIRNSGRNPTYEFLTKMLDVARQAQVTPEHPAYEAVQKIVSQHWFYDPIESIEDGHDEVMDIEVDDPDHSFVADGMINHNTLSSIAACCYLFDRQPNTKVVVLTKKSVVNQWADEVRRFTVGVEAFTAKGTPKQRKKSYEDFQAHDGPCVLVMGYRSAVQDFAELQEWKIGVLILDEATVVKNPTAQIHQAVRYLASDEVSERCWGLTATLIKNNLVEGYGIYRVVVPGLFNMTPNAFMLDYCVVEMQPIGKGRKVPVVVGYKRSDVARFRMKIEPYYLGRPKHAVATELPALTTKVVKVGMSSVQHLKYAEALAGLLEVGGEEKEVTKLTAVTYCQEIVNHPGLIQCDGDSEKLDTLVDMVTEGDLDGEKVIVYTRFERMVTLGIAALEKAGVKCVRVTGAETEDQRAEAQRKFQDPKSDTKVIWITAAGNDAINLQAAKALVFYDTPFSAGDYIQTLGRMIRIGSVHDRVMAIHLVASSTIDERVMAIMDRKMGLVEAVLGKRIKGEGDDDLIQSTNEIDAIFDALREDAKGLIRG